MNTLTGIEAERVDQILQHALKRLELLTYIPLQDDEAFLKQLSCVPIRATLDRLWADENEAALCDASAIGGGGGNPLVLKKVHRTVRACCR
jgi:hypothetical protein